jgi:cell division protein FtsW
MARKLASDKILFAALVALSLFGCVMIYSASAVSAGEASGNPYRYLVKQIVALALGGAAAFVIYRIDYRLFTRPWVVYTAYFGAFVLCGAALVSPPINAARRWLRLGPAMVQPSELLKVGLVLVLAHQLARRSTGGQGVERALVPCSVLTVLAAGVVMIEPDLGTSVCLVAIAACMLWLAGARLAFFGLAAAAAAPVLLAVALSAGYRKARLLSFLNPGADPLGSGFQAIQSLIAVGAGGWTGVGLGASRQKLFFLPYPHTDFIFAIVGEELGFLGAFGVVLGFALLAWRGLRTARRAPDAAAAFLAVGATAMLVVQAAINVSVVLALVPTKGIALPFISYGGSSLVTCWIAGGLLLNISQHEIPSSETA